MTIRDQKHIESIRSLMGPVTEEQLNTLDWYVSENIGLVLPSIGPCLFSKTISHFHPGYSFILHFNDLYQLEINGKILQTKQGRLTAISPNIKHHELGRDKAIRYLVVFISENYFNEQLKYYSDFEIPKFQGESFKSTPELIQMLKEFMFEFDNDLPASKALLNSIGLKITHTIIRITNNIASKNKESHIRINIDQAIQYIHENYHHKINIDELASKSNLSSSHFIRTFKQEIGQAPINYLINIRLDKAKKMLQATNKSVSEIALDCGFNSVAHFSDVFKKKFSVAPAQFRKSFQ